MDPRNQPQFNPKIPISEVLKQEQTGFVTSAPTIPRSGSGVVPKDSQNKIIKTYKSDAADAVRSQQQVSVAKIAIAQENQRRAEGEEIGAAPKKRTGLIFVAIILLLLGAAAIPTVKYILNQKTVAVPIAVEKTIIPFDHQENALLNYATRTELLAALGVVKAKPQTNFSIEYIKILENIFDANQKNVPTKIAPDIFAGILGPNMPSALARSFDSDYMFGIANSNNPKPFLLFITSSYEQTFANMLKWETKMTTDLAPIFNLNLSSTTATFTDQVIINKDVRAITAPDGTIVFLYGFLDNNTLVITTDPQTFQDINSRYVAARFVQ